MRKYFLVAGLLLASTFFVIAKKHHFPPISDEAKAELKEYKLNNIIPQMSEWKSEIDNSLSETELAQLDALRAQAKAVKEQMKAKMQMMKAKKEAGEEIDREAMKEEMKEVKEQLHSLIEKLKPIAEANKETLKSIVENSEDLRDKWHDDIREIVKTDLEENGEEIKERKRERREKRKTRKHHRAPRDHDPDMMMIKGGKRGMVMLLLWDGNVDEMNEAMAPLSVEDIDESQINSYPNPFSDKATIEFELDKPQKVRVYIIDDSGREIAELINEERSGKVSLEYVPEIEGAGIYFYKIEGETINKTGKLVLEK